MSGWVWWLFFAPVGVMLTGVRVLRHKNRYRGTHRRDAGIDIFSPPVIGEQLWWHRL